MLTLLSRIWIVETPTRSTLLYPPLHLMCLMQRFEYMVKNFITKHKKGCSGLKYFSQKNWINTHTFCLIKADQLMTSVWSTTDTSFCNKPLLSLILGQLNRIKLKGKYIWYVLFWNYFPTIYLTCGIHICIFFSSLLYKALLLLTGKFNFMYNGKWQENIPYQQGVF